MSCLCKYIIVTLTYFKKENIIQLTDEEKRELKWQRRKNKEKLTLQKKK